jgi:hypothetical protein
VSGVKFCAECGGPLTGRQRTFHSLCAHIAKKRRERIYQKDVREGRRIRRTQGPRVRKISVHNGTEVLIAPVKRTCLKCDKEFVSISSANRICQSCMVANSEWLAGKQESFIYVAALWDGIESLNVRAIGK